MVLLAVATELNLLKVLGFFCFVLFFFLKFASENVFFFLLFEPRIGKSHVWWIFDSSTSQNERFAPSHYIYQMDARFHVSEALNYLRSEFCSQLH